MEWRDIGFVLGTRRHGESALIVELLTAEHGRHAGLVRGGQSPRRRALLQPGNAVAAIWRGRLPEHLGTIECELVEAHAARLLDDPDRLAALNAAVALLLAASPEREPHADLHASFAGLLQALAAPSPTLPFPAPTLPSPAPTLPSPASGGGLGRGQSGGGLGRGQSGGGVGRGQSGGGQTMGAALDSAAGWARSYVLWECDLLAALGFGLDLGRCAVTGTNQDLVYVSPRTGRAVSRESGAPYHDKLLPLPGFLWRDAPAGAADIVAGLILTRHFLQHDLLEPQGGRLPEARERLLQRVRRLAAPEPPLV